MKKLRIPDPDPWPTSYRKSFHESIRMDTHEFMFGIMHREFVAAVENTFPDAVDGVVYLDCRVLDKMYNFQRTFSVYLAEFNASVPVLQKLLELSATTAKNMLYLFYKGVYRLYVKACVRLKISTAMPNQESVRFEFIYPVAEKKAPGIPVAVSG